MNRYLRFIAFFLSLTIFFSFPASADDYGSRWSSFLEYDTGTDKGNYLNFTSTGQFSYTLPFTASVRSVQGIVQTSGRALTGISFTRKGSTSSYPCTFISLGNSAYRFYLSRTDLTMNDTEFYLTFTNDGTSNTVVRLIEFEYSEIRKDVYPEKGSLWVDYQKMMYDENEEPYAGEATKNGTMSFATTPLEIQFGFNDDDISWYPTYRAWLSVSDWKKYDFIDFRFQCYTEGIKSIVGYCGGTTLPCEVSLFDSTGSRYLINYGENFGYVDPYGDRIRFDYYDFTTTTFLNGSPIEVTVTLDLRNLDRNITDTPYVLIDGIESKYLNNNYIKLLSCNGYVDIDEIDPLYYYLGMFVNGFADIDQNLTAILEKQASSYPYPEDLLNDILDAIKSVQTNVVDQLILLRSRMETWFDVISFDISEFRTSVENWFSKISGQLDDILNLDTSSGDEFQDDVSSQATEIEDLTDIIDTVTKPPVEDLDTSVEDIVDQTDIESNTEPLVSILENDIFLSVCIMSLTLALVSYGLYGKR